MAVFRIERTRDYKHTHTASIETQQLIIARYLEQNPEIIVVQTYIDNGATGTNFAGVR